MRPIGPPFASHEFGRIKLLASQRQLWIDAAPVKLGARAFDVLLALVERRDRVVTKDELLSVVWPNLVVEENNLQVHISTLRKLLGPQAVATIPGLGYRFTLGPAADSGGEHDAPHGARPPVPNNLPAEVNRFIGRETDLERVAALLGDRRLVTLTGFGGAGKTRLSLQVAARLRDGFPDGVWFVELAPLGEPTLVAHAIASLLKVSNAPQRTMLESVAQALQARRVLLVLDNCEHLVRACAEVAAALLRACPGVRILASSRENLGIEGEQVHPLAPLPLPASDGSDGLEAMLANPAVRLFVQRAAAARGGFQLGPHNAAAVASICCRLDGIPLALEFAAARLRVIGIDQIAEMLADRFGLLTTGLRGGLPHHQTLRATLDWSYGLLEPGERALLNRLSVFRGGFVLEAAVSVAASDWAEPAEVLDDLGQLVQKSLVEVDLGSGESRYWLLETVREYAREELAGAGESQLANEAHLDFFLRFAERVESEVIGPDHQRTWLHRLHLEHDNFRAALAFALQAGRAAQAHRICGALGRFWEIRGHYSEGRGWLRQALLQREGVPRTVLTKTLLYEGILAYQQADYAGSRGPCEASLALAREEGDQRGAVHALINLGALTREQGDRAQARRLFEQAQAIHDALGEGHTALGAIFALELFVASLFEGDFDRAHTLGERAMAVGREAGDLRTLGHATNLLGSLAMRQNEYDKARRLHEEALAIFKDLGHQRGVASALYRLGELELALGRPAAAQPWLALGFQISSDLGHALRVLCLSALARMLAHSGRPAEAAQLQGACAALLDEATILRMPSMEQGLFDATRGGLVASMGAEDYDAAFREGRSFGPEQIKAAASVHAFQKP